MQIGGEGIENLHVKMNVRKIKLKNNTNLKRHIFHGSSLWNGINRFQVRIWYDYILWDLIGILRKPTPLDHCH
jgi:hypothetical protein